MKKLLRGIADFRSRVRPAYRDMFAQLALGQRPDCLFIACADSRVVPNMVASTDPGDLFVMRNVGNLVPPLGPDGVSLGDESEWAAIEFAVETLAVSEIVVCGHSNCGAIHALHGGRERVVAPHLRSWLRHAEPALSRHADEDERGRTLAGVSAVDRISQLNVLVQIDHIRTYDIVRERVEAGLLRLHAWWFDVANADVYAFEDARDRFVLMDEAEAHRLIARLGDEP
ncbi:MAG: carbonic anhydrase [Myxococcota bacterium]